MTNFEWIKTRIAKMSEKEFINYFGENYVCKRFMTKCNGIGGKRVHNCNECLLDWLKSEVKEDEQ